MERINRKTDSKTGLATKGSPIGGLLLRVLLNQDFQWTLTLVRYATHPSG